MTSYDVEKRPPDVVSIAFFSLVNYGSSMMDFNRTKSISKGRNSGLRHVNFLKNFARRSNKI